MARIGLKTPAQYTTRSMRPCRATTSAAASASDARSVTSSASASLPGWARTKPSSALAVRAETMTLAPRACSSAAVARPMPVDAPTSQTMRPFQSAMRGFRDMGADHFL